MNFKALGESSICGLAMLALLGACGGERARASVPEAAVPAGTATLNTGIVRPAGESIGLSDEIIRLCKMDLRDRMAAPKYGFDQSDLQPGDRATLGKVAECLTTGALKGRSILLVGRADARGETGYNMVLGAQRAGGVADYLAHLGVARTRLDVTSRGELDAMGTNEAGWAADRRVDILLPK